MRCSAGDNCGEQSPSSMKSAGDVPALDARWHRKGYRLFWRWKSKPRGPPRVPAEFQQSWLHPARILGPHAGRRRTLAF